MWSYSVAPDIPFSLSEFLDVPPCVCAFFCFLSAWRWRVRLFAPCSLSLHSHSMTNVKRISSLRESSPSTRTRRVSRMAVTPTVSKLWDTHPRFRAEGQRRSRVGEGGGQRSQVCITGFNGGSSSFLPWSQSSFFFMFFFFFWSLLHRHPRCPALDADQSAGEKPSGPFYFFRLFHVTCPHMVVLYDPVLPPEIMSPPGRPAVFISPCWLLSAWEDTDLRAPQLPLLTD